AYFNSVKLKLIFLFNYSICHSGTGRYPGKRPPLVVVDPACAGMTELRKLYDSEQEQSISSLS
ncbi:MAG: hypothetical protein KDI74_18750, partial [Gammaproteobacteria bacterium]|nr:hypothetical protein [Gammaproteobacteria bacterium]